MNKSISLFWHRKDLRLNDNKSLYKSSKNRVLTLGVYILDPLILKSEYPNEYLSPAKEWFLFKSLLELEKRWIASNSKLLILKGKPQILIPKLAEIIKTKEVFWNINIEPYEKLRDIDVEYSLNSLGIKVNKSWDHLLTSPDNIRTNNDKPYKMKHELNLPQ